MLKLLLLCLQNSYLWSWKSDREEKIWTKNATKELVCTCNIANIKNDSNGKQGIPLLATWWTWNLEKPIIKIALKYTYILGIDYKIHSITCITKEKVQGNSLLQKKQVFETTGN